MHVNRAIIHAAHSGVYKWPLLLSLALSLSGVVVDTGDLKLHQQEGVWASVESGSAQSGEGEKQSLFTIWLVYIYIYISTPTVPLMTTSISKCYVCGKNKRTFVTVMCEHVLFCLQWRRKSLSLPPTDMNVVLGTRMCGKSRRRPEYVFFFFFFTLTESQIQKT